MKKTAVYLILTGFCLGLCFSLSACLFESKSYEIALINGSAGTADRSAAQGVYEGAAAYCEKYGVGLSALAAAENSPGAYLDCAKEAVSDGAKLLIFTGCDLTESFCQALLTHEDVSFLFVDCYPAMLNPDPRMHFITFREEQAGFFAGYAAVIEGYTGLGFIAPRESEIAQKYFAGFVQGAEFSAASKGLAKITIKYWNAKTETSKEEINRMAQSWYGEGVQIIMAYGGNIQSAITSAANDMKAKTIGCDIDQGGHSERYLTSAVKMLGARVQAALEEYRKDARWPDTRGGKTALYGIETDSVGLPVNFGSFRFTAWSVDAYEVLYAKVKSGKIPVHASLREADIVLCDITYLDDGPPEESLPLESEPENFFSLESMPPESRP